MLHTCTCRWSSTEELIPQWRRTTQVHFDVKILRTAASTSSISSKGNNSVPLPIKFAIVQSTCIYMYSVLRQTFLDWYQSKQSRTILLWTLSSYPGEMGELVAVVVPLMAARSVLLDPNNNQILASNAESTMHQYQSIIQTANVPAGTIKYMYCMYVAGKNASFRNQHWKACKLLFCRSKWNLTGE